MDQQRWTEVDRYIMERVLPADPALEAAYLGGLETVD